MSIHRYPPQSLTGDYVRAGLGLVLTGIPALVVKPAWPVAMMLMLVAALCAYFLFRTMDRHRTIMSYDEQGIVVKGFSGSAIGWDDVTDMALAYYSIRRDQREGWMQLTLKAGPRTIKIDSRMDGFVGVVRRAAQAAKSNGLLLNQITLANLRALRIT